MKVSDEFFKLLVLGDYSVGKTSLLKRLTQDRFEEKHTKALVFEAFPYIFEL